MTKLVLLSVLCVDRPGLVAGIADRLFTEGVNLRDAAFAALGTGAEFTAVCELPEGLLPDRIAADLRSLPELEAAEVRIVPYVFDPGPPPAARITHRIAISGGDQLGLVARLADIFGRHSANIVRMEARKLSDQEGGLYVTRFAVSIPTERTQACLAAIANTAGSLGLSMDVQEGAL